MVIFPGEFYGIILRCHQTCKPGKKTRGLNGGFPAVVGKNSSKNGGEFHGIPIAMFDDTGAEKR